MQAANGIRPATTQHDGTTDCAVVLCGRCAVVRSVFRPTRLENDWAILWHCWHDPKFSHFDTILARDGHTDRQTHMYTAYTMPVQCHAVTT